MAFLWLFSLWLLVPGTQGTKDGDMRLVNGASANEGRVEIFYRGQWGTVCDNLWNILDANVVCRALGYENATQALGRAAFGPGRGPVMLDEVECTGTEPSLANCSSLGWLKSRCGHEKDAGVVCSNETGGVHILDLSGDLPNALGQIFDSQQGCDLFIQVTGQGHGDLTICAHKLILNTNPEAQALWQVVGSSVIMRVDAECMPVVRDFLRYFYSRRIEVTMSSVKCLHKLASAYGATQLQDYCGRLFATLLPQDPTFRTPLELYAYAQATRDSVLEDLCVQFLAWNFEPLTQAEAWLSVPTALLQALLSKSDLAVSSELDLLKAVDQWSMESSASHAEVERLLEQVRFPMVLPQELFELQFNLSLYEGHRELFQRKTMEALEFHTVPFRVLAKYRGLNLTEDTYQPRLYTSSTWSTLVTESSSRSRAAVQVYGYAQYYPYGYDSRRWYYPYQSFQTPQHPSFLFVDKLISWSATYLPTVQSCWNYGFSCTPEELPVLGLTKSSYSEPAIGYENKALMLCGGYSVVDVANFAGSKAPIPSALDTNSSKISSLFPCSSGAFSGFRVVIRPFYLTNSTDLD
ncbi:galectin-3-binding protein precursor [Mesocricetus auratus]|uniref:Galectin-3-binding protein n=2 Tax=Mesocricetus auratus TaxID=10036 RepID=LG3BP_MESAU|nr:galectin-3-binding protein precursor [Mesocricetus auratus]P70117.1 RecName: Full=Galectin-3-binding protein; AltName: Full=Lectin galactoside-binding soluble 3-binding protein; AltName: Full=Mac-2-binding protein; Short=MAC2BP; Short=Mac-2 BP; AltName: Full=Pancreas cancer-associated protein 4; Flags: Precursor [Mesocricetus auratus]AAB18745.1 pancreas cancer-associated protein 4 [Mesocricetus auratus]